MELSRRKFLALLGMGGIGAGLAACGPQQAVPTTASAPAIGASASGTPTADEMDAAHEKGVKTFLANIEQNSKTFWPAKMPFTMDGDTKVFEITCQEVNWETEPGKTVAAFSYNGVVPGPQIRVTEGDKVRVIVKNQLKESTAIHWHGVQTPNNMDGVPFITQPPIKPGATFTYEFVAKPRGSHMYHSHHNAAEQVTKGLLGPFIIEPKDQSQEPKFDSDYIIVFNDANLGLTLNGKSFPATAPIIAKVGEKVRVRFMNEGTFAYPMTCWSDVVTCRRFPYDDLARPGVGRGNGTSMIPGEINILGLRIDSDGIRIPVILRPSHSRAFVSPPPIWPLKVNPCDRNRNNRN